MLPLDVYEYKRKWMPGYSVVIHSDFTDRSKTWCRKYVDRHKWSFTTWTDVYEHTVHFEELEDSVKFSDFIDSISFD